MDLPIPSVHVFSVFYNFIYLVINFDCAESSLLFFVFCLFFAQAFSSCHEQGSTLHCGARASHSSDFSYWGAQALGMRASVVAAHGLSSCSS